MPHNVYTGDDEGKVVSFFFPLVFIFEFGVREDEY